MGAFSHRNARAGDQSKHFAASAPTGAYPRISRQRHEADSTGTPLTRCPLQPALCITIGAPLSRKEEGNPLGFQFQFFFARFVCGHCDDRSACEWCTKEDKLEACRCTAHSSYPSFQTKGYLIPEHFSGVLYQTRRTCQSSSVVSACAPRLLVICLDLFWLPVFLIGA